MAYEPKICPTCKRPFDKRSRRSAILLHVLIGAVLGLVGGAAFVAYWFGTAAGFFHPMALIHEIAGIVLGMFCGLIVGSLRKVMLS